jgi:ketosteroid isomerase-like protein
MLMLVLASPLAACGGSDKGSAEQDEIATAVQDLQRAFAAENADRVCALLSTDARKQIEAMGHGSGGQRYFDLFTLYEGIQKARDWREHVGREVSDVVVTGDRATATVEFGDGQTAKLPLVHERGRWRVDALYGGVPASEQEDNY